MKKHTSISNLKGLLIFFVVLGHMLLVVRNYDTWIVPAIYSFHMPAFAFLNGLLSKRVTIKKGLNLLVLYFIFQILIAPFIFFSGYSLGDFSLKFTLPFYHLWYLLSLFYWYIFAFITRKLKSNKFFRLIGTLLTLIILFFSFTIRYFSNDWTFDTRLLSINRTLVFFPFFLLGLHLNLDKFMRFIKICKEKKILVLLISLAFIPIAYSLTLNPILYEILFYGHSPSMFFSDDIKSYALKIFYFYIIACLATFFIFLIISDKKCVLTSFGENSMSIYLLHPFITLILYKNFELFININQTLLLFILAFFSLLICHLLSNKIFARFVAKMNFFK